MRTVKFWLGFIAGALAWLVLASIVENSDRESAMFEAYANGMAEGIAIEEKVNKQRASSGAMQWWVGSHDMTVVRDRLCANYNRPKVK